MATQSYRCCLCKGLSRTWDTLRFAQRGGQWRPRCRDVDACQARRDAGCLPEVWVDAPAEAPGLPTAAEIAEPEGPSAGPPPEEPTQGNVAGEVRRVDHGYGPEWEVWLDGSPRGTRPTKKAAKNLLKDLGGMP